MDEAISSGYVNLRKIIGRRDVTSHTIAFCHVTNATFVVAGTSVEVTSPAFEGYLKAPQNHLLTSVAVTRCGRFAATSEISSNAQIRIWEVHCDGVFSGRLLHKLPANHQSINILKFTNDDESLISVSSGDNGHLIVWDWRQEREIASGSLTTVANDLAISFDNSTCVTVGVKSIKYWFLPSRAERANRAVAPLSGRSAILNEKRYTVFVGACFCDNKDRLMVVTDAGHIVEINNKRYSKTYSWTDPVEFKATCIAKTQDGLLVGCSDGRIRLFSLTGDDLDFISDVTSPAPRFVDPSMAFEPGVLQIRYPDSTYSPISAIASDPRSGRFVAGSADRTLLELSHQYGQWHLHGSSIVHKEAVNFVEPVPQSCHLLPSGTFLTSGNDASLRFWNLTSADKKDFSNILCPSLLKVIYLDEITDGLDDSHGKGITCTRISSDGRLCAAATRNGKIFILDLTFTEMPLLEAINAHDEQVNCIDFSDAKSSSDPLLLASGSDDGIVHIFRKRQLSTQFVHCAVLDTHQSPITAVRFGQNMHVYTTARNRTVAVWKLAQMTDEEIVFDLINSIDFTCTVNDLQITPDFRLVASCDDGNIRILDPIGRELDRVAANGRGLGAGKLSIDPTATFAATIAADKKVYVTDLKSGNVVATLAAFTSTPTSVAFTMDLRSLIVTSSCGNVYQWSLAKCLTQKIVVELRKSPNSRSLTPDSLLESGSEPISESFSIGGVKNSAKLTEGFGSDEFGSLGSLTSAGFEEGARQCTVPIPLASTERVGDSSFSPQVQQASSSAERRTTSNLFGHEFEETSETQSDFVSSRRQYQEGEQFRPSFGQLSEDPYSSSMINIRDAGPRAPTARELMLNHIAQVKANSNTGQPYQSSKSTLSSSPSRMHWGEIGGVNNNKAWPTSSTDAYGHRLTPIRQDISFSATPAMVDSSTPPPPLAPRTTSRVFSTPPSQNELSKIQSVTSTTPNSAFRRKTMDRSSLSKKYLENGNSQPKVWSPPTLATSQTPRRSNSNLFAAVQSAAAQQGSYRRPDEHSYTTSSALRSRSQSPNKLAVSRENNDSTGNLKGYRRRDSEMSYMSRSVSRGPGPRDPEMRKSTDVLNKLVASRNKAHQSIENLRKSTDNLAQSTSYGPGQSRTRSSSNLRSGAQLEAFSTFDADPKMGSTSSLALSRVLARSMTNLGNGLSTEGSSAVSGRCLANTIQMMKKVSNSDLTQPDQYEEPGQNALRIRGAVQKKVDRYKPRNRALSGRPQTSEESDSNNSDGYPLGGIKLTTVNRSTTNSDFSPASSTRSSILGAPLGSGAVSANRRIFDQQKNGLPTTPRRSGSYLVHKLSDAAHRTMEGPDLGSDESPRSSVNSLDFNGIVENSIAGRNPIVRHVQDCLEQLRINVDKSIQAKKLVEEDSTIPSDQKKIILCEIDKSIDCAIEKLAPKRSDEDNGNDYAPMKGQIYGVLKENLTSRQ